MTAPISTDLTLNAFNYSATIKASSGGIEIGVIKDLLPGVNDMALLSRTFENYSECVSSCRKLMDDFLIRFNAQQKIYKLGSEVNPAYSGQPTLSKDWGEGEVSRIWIYEVKMETKGSIEAVGQARIFGFISEDVRTIN